MAVSHAALFPLALLTPPILAVVLFVPPYIGIYLACYIAYGGAGANPIGPHWHDVFFIIDTYEQLFTYWRTNMAHLGIGRYALPITCFPLVTILFALWATRKLARKMRELFHTFAG